MSLASELLVAEPTTVHSPARYAAGLTVAIVLEAAAVRRSPRKKLTSQAFLAS